jgi:hypothetical protein
MTFIRASVARHAFLTAWAALSVIVAVLLALTGRDVASAVGFGIALGLAATVTPYLFDPIPTPLSRDHWLMRAPILRRLTRVRHWANPLYVELITLRSPYRVPYCGSELSAAILTFPWLPVRPPNIAGRVTGTHFVLKRMTFWADGGRPTAAGELVGVEGGTRIDLHVAAPAVGAYFLLFFIFGVIALVVAVIVGTVGAGAVAPAVVIVGAAALVVLGVFAIVASPLSPRVALLGQSAESDRYVAFFGDVLAADVISRE